MTGCVMQFTSTGGYEMIWKRALTFAAALAVASLAWGQVTITQGSLSPIGTSWIVHTVSAWAVFNVGPAGASQTWTFGPYTFDTEGSGAVLNPAETPYFDSFPTANRTIESDNGAYFAYYRVAANAAYWLGMVASDMTTVFDTEALLMPFPCSSNSHWTSVAHNEIVLAPGIMMAYTDSIVSTADGWGTVQTQFGSNAVLRVFSHHYRSTQITGFPPSEGEFLGYAWYTAGGLDVVSVTSNDGETDPNFGIGLLEMNSFSDPAAPPRGPLAQSFRVDQNYPNPFNPTTTLPVELTRNTHVTVTVYDETGRRILQDEYELPAGQHQLPVNGSDWATGTYFARVAAGAEGQTVKMQLVK
jgi:hypothetical protein